MSYCFQDKLQFQSKITNFQNPVYFVLPLKGFALELSTKNQRQKKKNDGATDQRKK